MDILGRAFNREDILQTRPGFPLLAALTLPSQAPASWVLCWNCCWLRVSCLDQWGLVPLQRTPSLPPQAGLSQAGWGPGAQLLHWEVSMLSVQLINPAQGRAHAFD